MCAVALAKRLDVPPMRICEAHGEQMKRFGYLPEGF